MIDPLDPTVEPLLQRLQVLALEQVAAGLELEATPMVTIDDHLHAQRRCIKRQLASQEEQLRIIDSLTGGN